MAFTLPLTPGQTGTMAQLLALGPAVDGAMFDEYGAYSYATDYGLANVGGDRTLQDIGNWILDFERKLVLPGPRQASYKFKPRDGETISGYYEQYVIKLTEQPHWMQQTVKIIAASYDPEERLVTGATLTNTDLIHMGWENLGGMIFTGIGDANHQQPALVRGEISAQQIQHGSGYGFHWEVSDDGLVMATEGWNSRVQSEMGRIDASTRTEWARRNLARQTDTNRFSILIVVRPPHEYTNGAAEGPVQQVTPTPATPACPVCGRDDVFVDATGSMGKWREGAHAMGRHRTIKGRTAPWCNGPNIAKAMSLVEACPRCDAKTWAHLVEKSSPVPCPECKSRRGTIQHRGAMPNELRFGVEIETEGIDYTKQGGEVARKLTKAPGKRWDAKEDGSLRGASAEFTSPPLWNDKQGLDQLRDGIRAMRRAGARASIRCGGHIHVGCEDLTYKHLASLAEYWLAWQDAILAAHPVGAERSRYCRPWTSDRTRYTRDWCARQTRDSFHSLTDKYSALNFKTLARINTVEFRFWNGSVHAEEIAARVKLCTAIVSYASRNIPGVLVPGGGGLASIPLRLTPSRDTWLALLRDLGITDKRSLWHLLGSYRTEADRPTAEDIAREAA